MARSPRRRGVSTTRGRAAGKATARRRGSARKPSSRKPPARKHAARKASAHAGRRHYWSGRVTRESDALDLDRGVFTSKDPKRIAGSLKRSAERSRRRKADPYRSALSMLVF